MIDTFERLIKAVEYMRYCQKEYKKSFSEKSRKKLEEAERIIDNAILENKKKVKEAFEMKQNELFK